MARRFSELLNDKLPSQKKSARSRSYSSIFESGFDSSDDDVTVADIEDASDDPFGEDDVDDIFEENEDSDDDSEEDELTPEEQNAEDSQEIDDTIKRVATPIIVEEILDEGEVAVFKESVDGDIAIDEGFFTERTIVRLDKGSRRKQLMKVSVLTIARQKKDPLYKKLATVWKMERQLEAKLYKKYEAAAKQRTNKYIQNAKKSKSKAVRKAAKRVARGR